MRSICAVIFVMIMCQTSYRLVGIVSEPGETTISASSDLGAVVENDWGFRAGQDDVVFWHYE